MEEQQQPPPVYLLASLTAASREANLASLTAASLEANLHTNRISGQQTTDQRRFNVVGPVRWARACKCRPEPGPFMTVIPPFAVSSLLNAAGYLV